MSTDAEVLRHVRQVLACGLEPRLKVTSLTMYLDHIAAENAGHLAAERWTHDDDPTWAPPRHGPCTICARTWDDCTADHVRTGRRCCGTSCNHPEAT